MDHMLLHEEYLDISHPDKLTNWEDGSANLHNSLFQMPTEVDSMKKEE